MTEYIEREALLARLKLKVKTDTTRNHAKQRGLESAQAQVRKAPAADVAPVVWCKDCWCAKEIDGFMGGVLYCKVWGRDTDKECFCSYGERKEADGNA